MASEYEELKELALLAKESGDSDLELKALEKMDSLGAPSKDFSFLEMAKNAPGSAANLVKDAYQGVKQVVTHPIDTAQAIGKTAAGGLYKANEAAKDVLPDFMTSPIYKDGEWFGKGDVLGKDQEPYADAMIDAVKGRYGSMDAAKETLQTDPVGVLADLAGVLSGTGAVTRSPGLSRLGAAMDPVNAASNTVKYTGGRVAQHLPSKLSPQGLYESAAKFGTTVPRRQQKIQTALDNRLMPSTAGNERLQGMIGNLNSQLDYLISTAEASGRTVPADAVFRHLGELRRREGGVRLDAPQNLTEIDRIIGTFREHLTEIGKDNLNAADLQKLKTDAYQKINFDARRQTGTKTGEEAYKAVARGAKELIEETVPGTRETNQALSPLYDLQESLQKAANRVENRDMVGLGLPAKMGAGSVVDPVIGTTMGLTSGIMDMPKPKAALAIQLNDLINNATVHRFIQNNPNTSLARLAAILAGRSTEESQE